MSIDMAGGEDSELRDLIVGETPAQAQTSLRLTQAPKADTARYDRLRPTHHDHLNGQEVGHA